MVILVTFISDNKNSVASEKKVQRDKRYPGRAYANIQNIFQQTEQALMGFHGTMRCWLAIQGLSGLLWQLWDIRRIARPMSVLVTIDLTLRAQISFFPLIEEALSMQSVPGILIVCVNHPPLKWIITLGVATASTGGKSTRDRPQAVVCIWHVCVSGNIIMACFLRYNPTANWRIF